MKFRNIEDRLAVVAAVIVLVGVTFAAEDALAGSAHLDIESADHTSGLVAGDQ